MDELQKVILTWFLFVFGAVVIIGMIVLMIIFAGGEDTIMEHCFDTCDNHILNSEEMEEGLCFDVCKEMKYGSLTKNNYNKMIMDKCVVE